MESKDYSRRNSVPVDTVQLRLHLVNLSRETVAPCLKMVLASERLREEGMLGFGM